MHVPRLVSVNCPSCGATIRIDATCEVATCKYCARSSFVHRKNEPVRQVHPGQENFGHIHLQRTAGLIAWIVGLTTILPFIIIGLVVLSIVLGTIAMIVFSGLMAWVMSTVRP